jgi:archaemetzincin
MHPDLTRRTLLALAAQAPALALAAAAAADPSADAIAAAMKRLRPLARAKTPPQPGDWLADHQEPGQSYQQFRELVKAPAVEAYSTLRLVPIGPLTKGQETVMEVVRDFLRPFFGLELAEDPPVSLASIPRSAQRVQRLPHPTQQLLTSYLLNETLMKRRQARDAAVLGITGRDLWPGAGWNFVFGQASLRERVGVWSMARNGDPDWKPRERALCAIRTTMTATHETGHMFGIRHCIAHQCGMNGSNNSDERDRQPLEFCPECQAKLWWTLELDPVKRSRELEAVARKHEFTRMADGFARQTAALQARRPAGGF